MKIKNLNIVGVGGLKQLTLDFDDQMNLICGPNGIGKTTILECIAHMFGDSQTQVLKRNVSSEHGSINIIVNHDGIDINRETIFNKFDPREKNYIRGISDLSNKLLSFKITRSFNYKSLDSVGRDTEKTVAKYKAEPILGIKIGDMKNWFVNRYLYSKHEGALTKEQLDNFDFAQSCFSLLDENYRFSKVEASSNEIMVQTPAGEIYYEYLSSGFKSIISIVFGIIKEIEFRFIEPRILARDFDGVVLIDELELHLHPSWQEKIAGILTTAFPLAQFIASTHSPHVIQFSLPNQIIALELDSKTVVERELPSSKYGYQGWTIEEILKDVMAMTDLRTDIFNNYLEIFQNKIEQEDYTGALDIHNEIDKLLHPNNQLRKLLKFQLAKIK